MDIIYQCVAGLDLHKETIVAAVRRIGPAGKLETDLRTFGTMTRDLLELSDWLAAHGVTHVAMEATGVLWKPVWNILDGRFELLLVNPRELKQVPGRKSDVKDAQWIAQLLQHGLLRSSFVPGRPQRELRDLTRHRAQLQGEHTRAANRIHKLLEDANIKLGVVASDILGVSGREILDRLVAGEEDAAKLAQSAGGRMKPKIPQLELALQGKFGDHHRFMLKQLLSHLDHLDQQIAQFNARIEELMVPFVDEELQEKLDAVPGVDVNTIQNVIAEIGVDMDQFPSDAHLASWTGICPGNEESAGKRKRSKTTKGNRWLRRALTQAAWAATHTKDSYLGAQYHRLAGRQRQETSPGGRRPHVVGDHLPHHQVPRRLSRLRPRLLPPLGARAPEALPGQASGTTGLRGATCGETRRMIHYPNTSTITNARYHYARIRPPSTNFRGSNTAKGCSARR